VSRWPHSWADCEAQPECNHAQARSLPLARAASSLRAGTARSGSPVREEVAVAARDDAPEPAAIELSNRVRPGGEVVVVLDGELDIVSAEMAVSHVRDAIDRCPGPMVVDLTALTFCDAQGLGALLRIAGYTERAAASFGWPRRGHRWLRSCGSPAWTVRSQPPRQAARPVLERARTMMRGSMA
jgi:anti-anti-sigma factor